MHIKIKYVHNNSYETKSTKKKQEVFHVFIYIFIINCYGVRGHTRLYSCLYTIELHVASYSGSTVMFTSIFSDA